MAKTYEYDPLKSAAAEQASVQAANTDVQPVQQNAAVQAPKPVNPASVKQNYYGTKLNAGNYHDETLEPNYKPSSAVKQAGQQLTDWEAQKPGAYQSAWNDQIQDQINNILGRKSFQYDVASDPLYQQYAQQYARNGQLAGKNAQADSAMLTGGYGNSYAQQVGQQTNQQYLEQLSNKIPELYGLARQAYLDEGDRMNANLGIMQGQDDREYGRYRDDVGDWQNMLNYYYNKYGDMSDDEYERYRNDLAAWQADRAYWYQGHRDDVADSQWRAEFNAKYGGGTGGSGSGGRGNGGNDKDKDKDKQDDTDELNGTFLSSIRTLQDRNRIRNA